MILEEFTTDGRNELKDWRNKMRMLKEETGKTSTARVSVAVVLLIFIIDFFVVSFIILHSYLSEKEIPNVEWYFTICGGSFGLAVIGYIFNKWTSR